jgi:hypothetical protein
MKRSDELQTSFHFMYMAHMHYQVALLFSSILAHRTLEHGRFTTLIALMPPQRTLMTVNFVTVAAFVRFVLPSRESSRSQEPNCKSQ